MARYRVMPRKLDHQPGGLATTPVAPESVPGASAIPSGRWAYRAAIALAIGLWVGHLLSLPVGITYDGYVYLDMAAVLGSSRFPADWNLARTPLFPFALKLSMWLFGRQPLALIAVSSVPALVGVLALGFLVKRCYGPFAGAVSILILSCYPTLATYGHYVLTETGTFCFIAISLCIACSTARNGSEAWRNALALAGILAAGYYWRQNILVLAWPFAAIHVARLWNIGSADHESGPRWTSRAYWTPRPAPIWRSRYAGIMQAALIVAVPYAATYPWSHYTNQNSSQNGLTALVLRYGIVKQALPAPDDPIARNDPAAYRRGIEQSVYDGHLYSGIKAEFVNDIRDRAFAWPAGESAAAVFIRLSGKYPDRYLAGVARTLALFFGARGAENENRIFRDLILSPTFVGAKIGDGPPGATARMREEFMQRTTDSALLGFFRVLTAFYDALIPAAFVIAGAGLLVALYLRSATLLTLCGIPLFYVLPYALTLQSVDRYAFPIYPVVLAAAVATVSTIARKLASGGKP